ncbi:MAG: hypothetical protein LBR17_01215 [Bacteroidales bacterium]|jgi:hypothetical protein|nr:hypothetical protein [Bacteroidales bacterium]
MVSKILKVFIPCAISILFIGCPWAEEVVEPYDSYYLIKNSSSQNLYFFRKSGINTNYIVKDSTAVAFCFATWEKDAYFHIGSDSLYVYASDSTTLLKVWENTYDTTTIGKQFYKESDWTFRKFQNPKEYWILEWTFEITDNDLQ